MKHPPLCVTMSAANGVTSVPYYISYSFFLDSKGPRWSGCWLVLESVEINETGGRAASSAGSGGGWHVSRDACCWGLLCNCEWLIDLESGVTNLIKQAWKKVWCIIAVANGSRWKGAWFRTTPGHIHAWTGCVKTRPPHPPYTHIFSDSQIHAHTRHSHVYIHTHRHTQ